MKFNIFGTRGGMCTSRGGDFGIHTPCLGFFVANTAIVFDLGSGAVELGKEIAHKKIKDIHIFMSHYHLDHVMGFPFLPCLYDKEASITIYGMGESDEEVRNIFETMFTGKYFPVPFSRYKSQLQFKALKGKESISIKVCRLSHFSPTVNVSNMYGNHNGDCLIYKLKTGKYSFVYLTDYENASTLRHSMKSCSSSELESFIQNSDVLIAEAQFTQFEYDKYRGCGHSTMEEILQLSNICNVGRLYITHLDSRRNDEQLQAIETLYNNSLQLKGIKLKMELAREEYDYHLTDNQGRWCQIDKFDRILG